MRRAAARAVSIALLASVTAGCLSGPAGTADPAAIDARLSQPLYDALAPVQVRVPSFDGVEIDNWLFLPDAPAGVRVPVLINFSPYWGNLAPPANTGGDAFGQYLVSYFVPRGYAVVLSSARGTGASDGCFTIGGPGELDDMRAVVDRFASEAWSNGAVGAGGKSYDGTMAQGLAVTGHPAVKAIFPVSPISEFYKYSFVNGVPYEYYGYWFNPAYVALVGWGVDVPIPGEPTDVLRAADELPPRPPSTYDGHLRAGDACRDLADVARAQYETAATGDYTPYWQDRNYSARAGDVRSDLGVFYVHGLGDWNVKPDHIEPWLDSLPRGTFVKAWLGQWPHEYPTRPDLNATLLRFFDHFLKGVDTDLLAEPRVQVESDDGVWRNEADWPPSRATVTVLHLDAGEALSTAPGAGAASWVDDGRRVAGSIPGANAAVWITPPLDAPLHYAGIPHLGLDLEHTASSGTVAAALYDVEGEGFDPRSARLLDQGFLDLRHRASMEKGEPVVPGARMHVSFGMYPQDDVVPAGHRLALLLTATGPEHPGVKIAPVASGGRTTVHFGEGSYLSLPVLADDPARLESPQPGDVGCWLC
ncbi:MAG TPA: CocE/NonD family hydrolase [Candidatus Thermoplasmatota archaeon]|nr:CocE/NonD family hydrolase [Candidatus Thermoplasmatota archaeon]